MFKPSVTVLRTPDGDVRVLACSEDSSICLDAYRSCEDLGEIVYIRQGHIDKRKQYRQLPDNPTAEPSTPAGKRGRPKKNA